MLPHGINISDETERPMASRKKYFSHSRSLLSSIYKNLLQTDEHTPQWKNGQNT